LRKSTACKLNPYNRYNAFIRFRVVSQKNMVTYF